MATLVFLVIAIAMVPVITELTTLSVMRGFGVGCCTSNDGVDDGFWRDDALLVCMRNARPLMQLQVVTIRW